MNFAGESVWDEVRGFLRDNRTEKLLFIFKEILPGELKAISSFLSNEERQELLKNLQGNHYNPAEDNYFQERMLAEMAGEDIVD
ncbi:hypothetical protein E308F_20660 [Moorella sp. E308F]|jgi:sorbitol-specific phosphotransferase system component IIA|uniref:hypothetical protein n=1 Tax=unclassified Neomoorella TaxID=2676739 RepID=UPI0010FFACFD|nr:MULTISPECIES: hypothetical protein [unclassified Moorella (in: firmicutes)]GEA15822.1 hypothetical protein E308F_20660 [Moorella sp. E308F]GEA19347.1 hypothetical protein E306M_24850 [Moorella sp. E306M]